MKTRLSIPRWIILTTIVLAIGGGYVEFNLIKKHPDWLFTALFGPPFRSPLDRTSTKLKPDMDRARVEELFAKIEKLEIEDKELTSVGLIYATLFKTNVPPATRLIFLPKDRPFIPLYEQCNVYFDTNGIIIGYRYSRDS